MLKDVWEQSRIPVVLRRDGVGEQLRVRLPRAEGNRQWLQNGRPRSHEAVWFGALDKRYWELPKAWFNDFVDRALVRYGNLYVIQPYREKEICAPACWNAKGHECQCSCMGYNHGSGNAEGFFEVSETFAVRWGPRQLACRLMIAKPRPEPSSFSFEDVVLDVLNEAGGSHVDQ